MRRLAVIVAVLLAAGFAWAPGSPAPLVATAHDPVQPDAQPDAQPETQPDAQPEAQPETHPGPGTREQLQPAAGPDAGTEPLQPVPAPAGGVMPAADPVTTSPVIYGLNLNYVRNVATSVAVYLYTASGAVPTGGTLTLSIDGIEIASQPYTYWLTNLPWTPTTLGSHTVSVSYSGTTDFLASTSADQSTTVVLPTPYLSLGMNHSEVAHNLLTTLTATLTPDPGPGDVAFKVDGATVATVPLTAGVATYDVSIADIGQHRIDAVFLGNADWAEAQQGAYLQVIGDGTAMSLDLPALPIPSGSRTVHVTLDPDPGTGVIQWHLYPDNVGGELPVGPGGVTAINLPTLTYGTYTLEVTFPATGTWKGASTSVQINVRDASATTLVANRTKAYVGEEPVTLRAVVTASGCPWGTTTLLDDTGSGPQVVAQMTAAYCNDAEMTFVYDPGAMAVGTHTLYARFDGGGAFASSTSAPVVITVAADTAAHGSFKPSLNTVYAYKDGWKDTVSLGGRLDERATVTVRVYSSRGSLKRSWSLGTKGIGAYSVKWNGTTSSGRKVSAGTYIVKAIIKDTLGHTATLSGKVVVSWRQAVWKTGTTVVKYGDQLKYYGTPGSHLYKSGDYSRGRIIDSGEMINDCVPGVDCDDIWGTTTFQLKTGVLGYRRTTVWVDGHGFMEREHPGTFYQVNATSKAWTGGVPLPEHYTKFGWGAGIGTASITSTRTFRVVLYCTQTWGDAWDVHRLKLTYEYAVWK